MTEGNLVLIFTPLRSYVAVIKILRYIKNHPQFAKNMLIYHHGGDVEWFLLTNNTGGLEGGGYSLASHETNSPHTDYLARSFISFEDLELDVDRGSDLGMLGARFGSG